MDPRIPISLQRPGRGRVVEIVSGSFGAGHDAAAREIGWRLEGCGYTVRHWDVVDLMPGLLGRLLRAAYLRQIRSAPSSWGWLLRSLEQHGRAADLIARAVASGGNALMDGLAGTNPAAVVSTHPFASQALGELRASGRLAAPAVTYLTDMSVHRLWVHDAVDLHLALHDLPAAEAQSLGAVRTTVVRPVVPSAFVPLADPTTGRVLARRALGLPEQAPLALMTGGSLGIGDLVRAAEDVARTGLAVPVVLCGQNDRLRRRLRRLPQVVALGWVDDMRTLYAAVDVVVQNAGGFTSLEARSMGLPTVTYRCIAGHGESNSAALELAGWAPWIRSVEELAPALAEALAQAAAPAAARLGTPLDPGRGLDVVQALFPVELSVATA